LPGGGQVDGVLLAAGKVGLGSFFDLGEFRNVRIQGDPAR
jgi:hypothetical protein